MKIMFMLPGLPIGGLERMLVNITNALSRRGHKITVMTFDDKRELADELLPEVTFIPKGLKPHPVMSRIPWIRHRWYDDGMWETRTTPERLHRYYVGEDKYDVEIAFFRGLSIKTLSAKRRDGKTPRRLAWVHTDFSSAIGWDYNFKDTEAVKRAYRSYDQVVCVSEQAKRGFIETLGDTGNLTTVYNLLPVEDILRKGSEAPDITVPRHKFNIVLVGRLQDSAKGQRRLIDVAAKLQEEGIDIGVTLVGGGPDKALIRSHFASKGAESYIHMTGSQKNPYPYIRQADLLMCASYYEGYNLTVAEALILGTPVLSTRCTGPVEILDDGKYGLIVENSTEGLQDGLRRLATDPELLQHYKEMTNERRTFFDEEKILSQIESLFKQ